MLRWSAMNFLSRAFAAPIWFAVQAIIGMAAFGCPAAHAGEESFLLTAKSYDSPTISDKTCESEFGKGSQIADWRDIEADYKKTGSLNAFFSQAKLDGAAYVTLDKERFYQGERHYFIERHNGNKPNNFIAHEDIGQYQLSLGSWPGKGRVLCLAAGQTSAVQAKTEAPAHGQGQGQPKKLFLSSHQRKKLDEYAKEKEHMPFPFSVTTRKFSEKDGTNGDCAKEFGRGSQIAELLNVKVSESARDYSKSNLDGTAIAWVRIQDVAVTRTGERMAANIMRNGASYRFIPSGLTRSELPLLCTRPDLLREINFGSMPFRITAQHHYLRHFSDSACQREFGGDTRMADWTDILDYFAYVDYVRAVSMDKFFDEFLDKNKGLKHAYVTDQGARGNEGNSSNMYKHYRVAVRDQKINSNIVADRYLDLELWRGLGNASSYPVLCTSLPRPCSWYLADYEKRCRGKY